MGACGGSIWAKIALGAILIAMVLDIIGFTTVSWMVYQISTNSVRVGLWRMKSCVANACTEGSINSSLKNATFTATQVFEILTFALMLLSPVVVAVYVFMQSARGNCMAMSAILMCFSASFFGFVGMICWVSYVPDPYVVSYSLGLTVIASILACIAGLLLIPDVLDDHGGRQRIRPNRRF